MRDRFQLPPDAIYLDGNSLGAASHDAELAVTAALAEWRDQAIDGWLGGEPPWFELGERLGALEAPLVGAHPNEVVVTGATTVNLHALVATFYQPRGRRRRIIANDLDFPSDLFGLASQIALRGGDPDRDLVLVPSRDGRNVDEADLIAALADEVALALVPSVLYRSGQLLDLRRLAAAARERGVILGADLAHSVGCIPHGLHDWGVDFAFWCGYKYLNGGPGAPAGLFVHRRHHGTRPALAGWWGSEKARQFDMAGTFMPAAAAGAWQISTPSVLAMAALRGALAPFAEIGIEQIRARSLALTDRLIALATDRLAPLGFTVGTPREHTRRGGHVALEHPRAVQIARALKARRIIPDFRPPNVIRLAPIALYSTFDDVHAAVTALAEIVTTGEHARQPAHPSTVA